MDEAENTPQRQIAVAELKSKIEAKIRQAVILKKKPNIHPVNGERDLKTLLGTGRKYYDKIHDLDERGLHEVTIKFPDHTGHIVDTGGLVCGDIEDEFLCPLVKNCAVLIADVKLPTGETVRVVSHDIILFNRIIIEETINQLKKVGVINKCTIAYNGNIPGNITTHPQAIQAVKEATGVDINPRNFTNNQHLLNKPFDLYIQGDGLIAFNLSGYS